MAVFKMLYVGALFMCFLKLVLRVLNFCVTTNKFLASLMALQRQEDSGKHQSYHSMGMLHTFGRFLG